MRRKIARRNRSLMKLVNQSLFWLSWWIWRSKEKKWLLELLIISLINQFWINNMILVWYTISQLILLNPSSKRLYGLVKAVIHFRYRKKRKGKLSGRTFFCLSKPLDTFGTENKLKVHRFTNNLERLQKVMVKDFSWNIIPWNALLFEKTFKLYQLSISRITDLF